MHSPCLLHTLPPLGLPGHTYALQVVGTMQGRV